MAIIQSKKMLLSLPVAESGMIIPIAAGAMLMIAGVTAFAVDIGYQRVVDNELQNIADTAALAGAAAMKFPLQPKWAEACSVAKSSLVLNKAAGQALNTGNGSKDFTLETGYADSGSGAFMFSPHAQNKNACAGHVPPSLASGQFPAIRVVAKRTADSSSGGITSFFAKIFGLQSLGARSEPSAAMIGAPSTVPAGSAFPMALSLCTFQKYWDVSTGLPKVGWSTDTGLTTSSITLISAQSAGNGNNNNNGNNNGNGNNSGACVDEMQWTTLDPTESNINLTDDVVEGTCGGSPNSASKVNCLISGALKSKSLSLSQGIPINIQNGNRSTLFQATNTYSIGKIALVPVVATAALTIGDNSVTPILDFVPVQITSATSTGNTKSVSVKFVAMHKLGGLARPGTGPVISGAATRAFLIQPGPG